jgi:hypothetical protein
MSRRSRREKRGQRPPGREADAPARATRSQRRPARREADTPPPAPRRPQMSLAVQLGILVAVFLGTTLIAELAGAANLGVALGIGQIAFAIAAVWLIVWR